MLLNGQNASFDQGGVKGVGKTDEVFPWTESRLHPEGEPLRTEEFSRSALRDLSGQNASFQKIPKTPRKGCFFLLSKPLITIDFYL